MATRTKKADWSLNAGAFHLFLSRLDPDGERAGERYEQLRRRLIGFFEWRGSLRPDEQADLAINRIIRRIEEGESVENVQAYALGVARLLLFEELREQEKQRRLQAPREGLVPASPGHDMRGQCLETCLDTLPPAERELILSYYGEEGGGHIGPRRALAARLGFAPEALRARAFRIRERLDGCVHACLEGRLRSRGIPPRPR